MAPLAAAPAILAMAAAPSTATPSAASATAGVAFKLQTKSAAALVKERRIEFVRARNSEAVASTAAAAEKKKTKHRDVLVPVGEIERVLQWRHAKKIGPGLANLGNTCYLNSVLQCLSYTPSFAQYLLRKNVLARFNVTRASSSAGELPPKPKALLMASSASAHQGQGFCGVRFMARLLQSVHGSAGTARVLQPKELVMNIRHVSKNFRIGRQEDSHEFFRLLLDAMQRACLRRAHIKSESHPAASTTFIHRVFGGKLRNTLKCAKCPFVSERLDDFLDLSLEIAQGVSSVRGAIKHFTATETLDASNAWRCSGCNQLTRAEKGMTIDTCPNVLVVQLKRFDAMFGKIKKHVEFGTTLDLAVGMAKGCEDRRRGRTKYELHAVLVHAGFSTNCGHYYAFVKGSSGQWYEMNDESVRWVSVETVLQQKAYMLFYSRVLPPSEQPPPVPPRDDKPVPTPAEPAAKTATAVANEPESLGEPVEAMAAANGGVAAKKPAESLTMDGFLASLRTDLEPATKGTSTAATAKVVPVARPETVVTYKFSVPAVKNRATLKRRLVPVFAGAIGRFVRYQPSAWKAAAPLSMMATEEEEVTTARPEPTTVAASLAAASVATSSHEKPAARIVERVAFNPRELRGFGEKNSALFGRSVDQWAEPVGGDGQSLTAAEGTGDGPTATSGSGGGLDGALAGKHARVLQQLRAEDWAHRRAQRKNSWDEALDAGKTKKLKKRTEFVANEGCANAFQLALVQKKRKQ